MKPQNVLVIDSAERIEASEFVVIRQLLQAILPNDGEEIAADWARFQFLKQIWTDTPHWAALAPIRSG